jgi:hypothetical protein
VACGRVISNARAAAEAVVGVHAVRTWSRSHSTHTRSEVSTSLLRRRQDSTRRATSGRSHQHPSTGQSPASPLMMWFLVANGREENGCVLSSALSARRAEKSLTRRVTRASMKIQNEARSEVSDNALAYIFCFLPPGDALAETHSIAQHSAACRLRLPSSKSSVSPCSLDVGSYTYIRQTPHTNTTQVRQ